MRKLHKLPIITTLLMATFLVACNAQSASFYSKESSSSPSYTPSFNPTQLDAVKVFDYFLDDGYPEPLSFEVKELGNSPFTLDENQNVLDKYGHFIINAGAALYLYDVNGDGYRDLCMIKQNNSETYSTSFIAYDALNKEEVINYQEIGRFNYYLEIKDYNLGIYKTHGRFNETRYAEGIIDSKEESAIKWNNIFDINDFSFFMTQADVSHTPINYSMKGKEIKYNINKSATYLLEIAPQALKDSHIFDDLYAPVSFISDSQNVVIYNPLKNKPFTYALYFQGREEEYRVDVILSGISKSLIFRSTPSGEISLTFKDVYPWAKEINTSNINEIEIKEELLGDNAPISRRGIGNDYQFTDQASFETLTSYFDEMVYEVSPSDFINDELNNCTGVVKTNTNNYDFECKGNFFIANDKCYMMRRNFEMNRFVASSTSYFFDREVKVLSMEPINSRTTHNKIIDNPEDMIFNKRIALDENLASADYSFDLRGAKYYVLDSKNFMDSASRYVYEIISSLDFSSLFV